MDSKVKYGLFGAGALYVTVYLLFAAKFYIEGYGLTPPWIYWFDGILGWWILFWSLLVGGCCYGLRKEFLGFYDGLARMFPDIPVIELKKVARLQFMVKYAKTTLPFLYVLPAAYLCYHITESLGSRNWILAALLFIPAVVTTIWLIAAEKKCNTAQENQKINLKRIIISTGGLIVMMGLLLILPTPYSTTSWVAIGSAAIIILIAVLLCGKSHP